MADQEQPIEEQISAAKDKLDAVIRDPSATSWQKRERSEELSRLCSRRIVARQLANEPKPIILKEVRK